jgi:hypothetical protein
LNGATKALLEDCATTGQVGMSKAQAMTPMCLRCGMISEHSPFDLESLKARISGSAPVPMTLLGAFYSDLCPKKSRAISSALAEASQQ